MRSQAVIFILAVLLLSGARAHAQDPDCTAAQLELAFTNRGRGAPLEMLFDVRNNVALEQLERLPAGVVRKPSPGETISLSFSDSETSWKVTLVDDNSAKSTCTLKASYLWKTYFSNNEASRGFANSDALDGNAALALLGLPSTRPVEAVTTLRLAVTRDRTATLSSGQSTLADAMGAANQLRRRFTACGSSERYEYRAGNPLAFSVPLAESVNGSNVKGSYATVMLEVPGGAAPNDCFIIGYVFADSRQAIVRIDGSEYRVPVASVLGSSNLSVPYLRSPFSQSEPAPTITVPAGIAPPTATAIGFFVTAIGSAQRGEFGGACPPLEALIREVKGGQFQVRAFPETDGSGNVDVSLTACVYRQIGRDPWGEVSSTDSRYLAHLQPIKFEACVDDGSCVELPIGTGKPVKARIKNNESFQFVATVRDGATRTLQLSEQRVVVAREQMLIVPKLTNIPPSAAVAIREGELNASDISSFFCSGWPESIEAASAGYPAQWLAAEFVVDGNALPISVERWTVRYNPATNKPERFCAVNPTIGSTAMEMILSALRSPSRQVFSAIRQRTEDGGVSTLAMRRLYFASHEKFVRLALFTGVDGTGSRISSYIYGLPVTRYARSLCIQPQNTRVDRVDLDLNRVTLVDSLGQVSVRFRSLASGFHEFVRQGTDGWYCTNIGNDGVLAAQSIAAVVEPVTGSTDSTLAIALDGKTKVCITSASDETLANCSATLNADKAGFNVLGDAVGYAQVSAGSWQVRQWRVSTEGTGLASREPASQFRISGNIPALYAFWMEPGKIGFSAEAGIAASIPLSDNSVGARGLGLALSPYSSACFNVALLKSAIGVVPRACAAVALDVVSAKAATDAAPAALGFGFPSWSITLGLGGK